MARIRTIKPEFFKHEELFEAELKYKLPLRIAFAGIWCICDREGRFKWKPNAIKLDVLPYDKCDFSKVLDALKLEGFINYYEIDNNKYGYVPSFLTHQVINNRESASSIPKPKEEHLIYSRVDHASTTPLNTAQGEGNGIGKEGEWKESQQFIDFKNWLLKNAANVAKMDEQLTEEQFNNLFERFDKNIICDNLIKMHNWKNLLKKNISVNLTVQNWISRETK